MREEQEIINKIKELEEHKSFRQENFLSTLPIERELEILKWCLNKKEDGITYMPES